MEEIRLLRKKLQRKKSELMSTSSAVADRNIQSFINFTQTNEIILKIINEIELGHFDWESWEANLRTSDYQIPIEDDKAARFCFEVLNKNSKDVWEIAVNFHAGSSNRVVDHIHRYLEIFVPPLFNYLDEKLQEIELMISPSDMVKNMRNTIVGVKGYEDIETRLTEAYKKLYVANTNDDYNGIANICRALLVDLVNQVFLEQYVPNDIEHPKKDDAKAKLKYTYRALQEDKNSKFVIGRGKIIDGLWDMVSANVHRKTILKEEAEEIVLLTYLVVKTFIELNELKN